MFYLAIKYTFSSLLDFAIYVCAVITAPIMLMASTGPQLIWMENLGEHWYPLLIGAVIIMAALWRGIAWLMGRTWNILWGKMDEMRQDFRENLQSVSNNVDKLSNIQQKYFDLHVQCQRELPERFVSQEQFKEFMDSMKMWQQEIMADRRSKWDKSAKELSDLWDAIKDKEHGR